MSKKEKQAKPLTPKELLQNPISKERYLELIVTLDSATPRNEVERRIIEEMKQIRAQGRVIDTSPFD